MTAPNANMTFWAFIEYVRNNPHKSVDAMTENDLLDMAALYQAENADAITDAMDRTTYPYRMVVPTGTTGAFTDVEWPGSGVSATSPAYDKYTSNVQASVETAWYPEDHKG